MATANDSSSQIQKTPFVKELASSERKTRDKALESLTLFLRARRDLSLLELLKIWKGLFFCFYHSDRPLTQQALARALSYSLVPSLPEETRLRFLRAFWITIGREFHALDRLRLDKYLFLIRCYVGVAFEIFLKKKIKKKENVGGKEEEQEDGEEQGQEGNRKRKRGANTSSGEGNHDSKKRKKEQQQQQQQDAKEEEEAESTEWPDLEAYISLLEEGPLCPINFDPTDNRKKKKTNNTPDDDETIEMPHGPDGLRYHLIDIWIDELAKVIDPDEGNAQTGRDGKDEGEGEESTSKPLKDRYNIPIDLLFRPFEKLKKESPTKTVRIRAGEVLDDERLVQWGFRTKPVDDDEDDEDEDDEEWGGFGD
ncbi:hypothetical protein VTN77DRAFT_742 [Rasamsonia byssochlamydoides]|uniref:uncharacterized protein n=1 Tax=Rasamsonia byssochlamydoides TaxID=89139 RepID=UPI0037435E9E